MTTSPCHPTSGDRPTSSPAGRAAAAVAGRVPGADRVRSRALGGAGAAAACLLSAVAAAPAAPTDGSDPAAGADGPVPVTTTPPRAGDRRVTAAPPTPPPMPTRPDGRVATDGAPSTGASDPGARRPAADGPAPGRPVPRPLGSHGPASGPAGTGSGGEPPAERRLRIEPGRFMPVVAAPGRGVSLEAIVVGVDAGDASGAAVRVVAHVRPHAALGWTTHELRRVPGRGNRWQVVIPCSPCLSEPDVWLQAVAVGAEGVESAWWPSAGGSAPADYAVGYERLVADAGDAVLGGDGAPPVAAAGGGTIDAAGTSWTGPTWLLEGVRVPMVRFRARLEAASARDAALEVLARPGGLGPWTRVAMLESPVTGWREVRIDVRDHLPDAAAVQVRVRLLGGGAATARVDSPRLADLVCGPGVAHGPDVDGDGVVGLSDLVAVMSVFGPCDRPAGCREDVDGSGTVDLRDALDVIAAWEPAATASASGAA